MSSKSWGSIRGVPMQDNAKLQDGDANNLCCCSLINDTTRVGVVVMVSIWLLLEHSLNVVLLPDDRDILLGRV